MNYLVSLSAVREKISIIKCVRHINGWGLKDSKDWVEDNFTFDSYMTEMALFDITVDEAQLGRLCAYTHTSSCRGRVAILNVQEVRPVDPDMFDFTRQIF